jgi:hypothetical protein
MTDIIERSDVHRLVSISDVGQNRRFAFSPPTKETRRQPAAKALGLHGGITVEKQWGAPWWRCANCNRMQPEDPLICWVADGRGIEDPELAITETERESACDGTRSAWCLPCARRLSGYAPWWKFWEPTAARGNDVPKRRLIAVDRMVAYSRQIFGHPM